MNYNLLQKLEFCTITEKLASFCSTFKGRNLALELTPHNKKNIVEQLLAETEEAVNLAYRNSYPSFYDFFDITIELKNLESFLALSTKSLLNLANILKLAHDLKDYFNKDFLDTATYPILSTLFNQLYTNKEIYSKIFSCIIDENTIDDKASKSLMSIRKQKRKLEQDIKQKLNDILHSSTYGKYIQEHVVTIRNDRFVIPVKEEFRTQIKGFVHDISNAGSTVFIEPISIFEMNNELNTLKVQEDLEIEKILKDLSSLFFQYTNELELDVNLIGKLDFIFAKAKFSKSINGITPIINDITEIHLIKARHPLIDENKVVPISLDLGDNFSILLITGPNTGGKTVALKTVGLLTCMACSGLNIPASEKSSIYVFDSIFADIGDNQSILDSLSTFSSHMSNIIEIINTATSNSLILVDELGSGTDPLEGARLAISILDHLKSMGVLCIATTHYTELKQYALVTNGFENASVEFDIATLSPTYNLLMGIPGKSNAFEISKKLGLKQDIIDNAQKLMSSNQIDFENLLKNIYDNKSLIEKEKAEISNKLNEINNLQNALNKENIDLKQKELDIINSAKLQARNILLDAKENANEIIKKMSDISSNKDLENLRNEINKKIKDIKLENFDNPLLNKNNHIAPSEVLLGHTVFVKSLNTEATVISHVSKSNTVQVQVGSLKMTVSVSDLEKLQNTKNTIKTSPSNVSYSSLSKSKTAKTEINVIGLNVEEAIFVVDKFLDDSILAKLKTVRIIHGKGTGKLRTGIHTFLKNHPHVKSFRLGTFGEGEMGVTVVELK